MWGRWSREASEHLTRGPAREELGRPRGGLRGRLDCDRRQPRGSDHTRRARGRAVNREWHLFPADDPAPLGVGLLVFGVVVIAAGYAATYFAARLLRAGRPIAVVLVVLATTFLCAFPALWVVLLGPALLILMSSQPS